MRSPIVLTIAGILVLACLAMDGAPAKKRKEEATQTLEAPPDPPPAVVAETRRLLFQTSALSPKGLLSQQIRDALRDLMRQSGGNQVAQIRVFVSGTGDLRRVPQLVGETFAEKKHLQLPAVTVIQAGGLPVENAQVVLEITSVAKRDVNPLGLLFVSAREHSSEKPLQPLGPLADQSLDDIASVLSGRGEAVRVTCFTTALDSAPAITAAMSAKFPGAALDLVQTQRASSHSSVACEAVARATVLNPPASTGVTYANSDRVVLTGTQTAFGYTVDDARLAYRRFEKLLGGYGASLQSAVALHIYPLSASIAAQAARVRKEFVKGPTSAVSEIQFESLPGMDSAFALEAVAPASTQP
jgi:enamine deaminase RidA (YjgF/YER057c/UK114 family)